MIWQPDARGSADAHVQTYRPDIDGLRAVAVVSVIAYHAFGSVLPGGYTGVDVFFVISGYLITTIIVREHRAGRFSIRRFYERRVRRIMPALLLVLFATTVASAVLLLPADLVAYGKSLLATLGFAANVYFFRDAGYFSPAAEQKPLLHMWSLGVEEQFYLVFPLLLILLARWPRVLLPGLAALTLLSLGANAVMLWLGKSNPAFYLIPFRAWELGAGALLAVWLHREGRDTIRRTGGARSIRPDITAVAGSVLVAAALLGFNPPPSSLAPAPLFAVVGTTLLIWVHHRRATAVSRLLGSRPFVGVGLISFSLYLWHWPLLVLPSYWLVRDLDAAETTVSIAAAVALSALSWRYVERPFRQKSMPARRVYRLVTVPTAAGIAAGLLLWQAGGFPGRLDAAVASINQAVGTNYRCPVTSYIPFGAFYACPLALPSADPDDADTVLFGNSHAQMYAPLVEALLREQKRHGLLVPANGCLPTIGVNISANCTRITDENTDAILALPRVRTVIIASTWEFDAPIRNTEGEVLTTPKQRAIIDGLDRMIDRLRRAGKRVAVVGPIAIPGYDIASEVSRRRAFGHALQRPTGLEQDLFLARFSTFLDAFRGREDITFIEPHRVQCSSGECVYIDGSEALFADSNHLATKALDRFRPIFASALASSPLSP